MCFQTFISHFWHESGILKAIHVDVVLFKHCFRGFEAESLKKLSKTFSVGVELMFSVITQFLRDITTQLFLVDTYVTL